VQDEATQQVDAADKVRAGSKPRPLQLIDVLGATYIRGSSELQS
jgi:hypothetical protein